MGKTTFLLIKRENTHKNDSLFYYVHLHTYKSYTALTYHLANRQLKIQHDSKYGETDVSRID